MIRTQSYSTSGMVTDSGYITDDTVFFDFVDSSLGSQRFENTHSLDLSYST